jgi:hypothetical protein
MKNLQKKITEFLPARSTKKSAQNFFSVLQEKFVCFKFPCIYRKQDFSLFLRMVGLSPGIICHLPSFEVIPCGWSFVGLANHALVK